MFLHSLSQSGPPPRSLLAAWLTITPIFDHEAFFEALVEHLAFRFEEIDEPKGIRFTGGFLVQGVELLFGQESAELFNDGLNLPGVAEAPDAHELRVDPDAVAHHAELLAR